MTFDQARARMSLGYYLRRKIWAVGRMVFTVIPNSNTLYMIEPPINVVSIWHPSDEDRAATDYEIHQTE